MAVCIVLDHFGHILLLGLTILIRERCAVSQPVVEPAWSDSSKRTSPKLACFLCLVFIGRLLVFLLLNLNTASKSGCVRFMSHCKWNVLLRNFVLHFFLFGTSYCIKLLLTINMTPTATTPSESIIVRGGGGMGSGLVVAAMKVLTS